MPWLAISGIDLSAVIATGSSPKAPRRDIGDVTDANDGSKRATRTTRKYDFSGESIPLSPGDAFVWESLITGAGEVYTFDSSFYSTKGLGPTTPPSGSDLLIQNSIYKFGGGALKMNDGFDWASLDIDGFSRGGTAAVWYRIDSGAWHFHVKRTDGSLWIDGVASGAATPIIFSGNEVILQGSGGTTYYFDDLVACPYLWPSTWPALVYANAAPFSPLPYLTCAGDLVPEAATRKMIGQASVSGIIKANPGSGMSKATQKLQVDLLGA